MKRRRAGHERRRSNQRLLRVALRSGDIERIWRAIAELQSRGSEALLATLVRMAGSSSARRRTVALDIAGQLGSSRGGEWQAYALEPTQALLLAGLDDPALPVRIAAAAGLGHRPHPEALPKLIRAATHPNWRLRFDVALALGSYKNEAAAEALLALMRDPDDLVRDWATFSLGTLMDRVDSPAIREGLARNLQDPDPEVRSEAAKGLAVRKDARGIDDQEQLTGTQQLAAELQAFKASALASPGQLHGRKIDRDEGNARA